MFFRPARADPDPFLPAPMQYTYMRQPSGQADANEVGLTEWGFQLIPVFAGKTGASADFGAQTVRNGPRRPFFRDLADLAPRPDTTFKGFSTLEALSCRPPAGSERASGSSARPPHRSGNVSPRFLSGATGRLQNPPVRWWWI